MLVKTASGINNNRDIVVHENNKDNHLNAIKDNRGFTFVELALYLALLLIVLTGIFSLYDFAQTSWNRTEAQDIVIQETRLFLMHVERDIRSARRRPNDEPAIKIMEQGKKIEIFTYHYRDALYVSYIHQNDGSLERLTLVDPEDASELPITETLLSQVVPNVDNNGDDLPLFSIVGKSVLIRFGVDNPVNSLSRIYEVDAVFTVRNKEAF